MPRQFELTLKQEVEPYSLIYMTKYNDLRLTRMIVENWVRKLISIKIMKPLFFLTFYYFFQYGHHEKGQSNFVGRNFHLQTSYFFYHGSMNLMIGQNNRL